jgi:signal transduction histidine kinase
VNPLIAALLGAAAALLAVALVAGLRRSRRPHPPDVAAVASDPARAIENDVSQLASVAAHDLAEPLRIVVGFADLLAEGDGGTLTPQGRTYVAAIGRAAHRMELVFDALLRYWHIDNPEEGLERIALDDLLNEALDALSARIAEAGAIVTRGPLPVVEALPWQLVQVFQNLLANAIKFNEADRPVIHVSAEQDGSVWRISVADNGIGIAAADARRIFDMFQRLDRQRYPGTGLGLAIVRRIVERHGGDISVSSAPGRGSTFVFGLPTVRRRRTDAPGARTYSSAEVPAPVRVRVGSSGR